MARHHKRHEAAEINLTSMIDFLTILVFFLLVHGGFVRLAILELNLPTANSTPTEEPPSFQLEVTVRSNGIEVGDRTQGTLNKFEKDGDKYPYEKLSKYLAEVKQQFPQKNDATLLLEPDIPYDVLVAVMDHVRLSDRQANGSFARTELFPQISIGDAPVLN
jgi:biopolymer transport protein ExbD